MRALAVRLLVYVAALVAGFSLIAFADSRENAVLLVTFTVLNTAVVLVLARFLRNRRRGHD